MWLNKKILPYMCFGCDDCKGTDKELTVWHIKIDYRSATYFTMPNKQPLYVGWYVTYISESAHRSVEDFLRNRDYENKTRVTSYQEYLTVTDSKFV